MWPMIIGAAIGAIKDAEAQREANRQRQVQAQVTRYSPWTGMTGQSVANPSLLGNVAQGAAVGGSFGQNLKDYNAADAVKAANAETINQMQQISQQKIPVMGGSAGWIGGASTPAGGMKYSLMGNSSFSPRQFSLMRDPNDPNN